MSSNKETAKVEQPVRHRFVKSVLRSCNPLEQEIRSCNQFNSLLDNAKRLFKY